GRTAGRLAVDLRWDHPLRVCVRGWRCEAGHLPDPHGVLFVIGGYYFLTHPLMALSTLTLLLAALILAAGVCEIITYFRLRGEQASGWMLFNGIVALFLGALIWLHWPSSSVWAIGTLVGVNLLLTGITRL